MGGDDNELKENIEYSEGGTERLHNSPWTESLEKHKTIHTHTHIYTLF